MITCIVKIYSCCYPTYEPLDPVSKVVNWSQHPLQDPIHKGRTKFTQVYVSGTGKVYVQWAILCRRWQHGTFHTTSEIHGGKTILLGLKGKWFTKFTR